MCKRGGGGIKDSRLTPWSGEIGHCGKHCPQIIWIMAGDIVTIKMSHFHFYRTFYVGWLVDHIDGTHKEGHKGGTQGVSKGADKGL